MTGCKSVEEFHQTIKFFSDLLSKGHRVECSEDSFTLPMSCYSCSCQNEDKIKKLLDLVQRKNSIENTQIKIDRGDITDIKQICQNGFDVYALKSIEMEITNITKDLNSFHKQHSESTDIVIKYAESPEKVSPDQFYNFDIRLINCDFVTGFNIDRNALYELLKKSDALCKLEPCIHACVDIKYRYKNRDISVFVFEGGSIIITGACTSDEINAAYDYINNFIFDNFNKVIKISIASIIKDPQVKQMIKDFKKASRNVV
jgi:TATA-box binding protein (TBP) (component of TFIID and TFIIIB)